MDRLDALMRRLGVRAAMFHSGPLCGINDFSPDDGRGQLHLVKRGQVRVENAGQPAFDVVQPTLLFYPRPLAHRFVTDEHDGADMVCAHVAFSSGAQNPVAASLPAFLPLSLDALPGSSALLTLLFDEAFGEKCGRQLIVDRLFEVVLVQILRHIIDQPTQHPGVLAGMADPQLAKALVALHETPGAAWNLERLAQEAGLSRTVFAERFKARVGQSPGAYVLSWRMALCQRLLLDGRSVAHMADAVGYASEAALSRAFRQHMGESMREWRHRQQAQPEH